MELRKRTSSMLSYKLNNVDLKNDETTHTILQYLDRAFNENPTNTKLSFENPEYHKIFNNEIVVDMLYMLHYRVEGYFISKKRIFAGWDKYPFCSPPIHHELAEWLEGIKKTWFARMDILTDQLAEHFI